MKYQAIIKYCPVTASQKGWEHCLGEFETEKEAEEFFDANAEKLLPPMARQFGFARRMLFLIKKKKEEETNED